MEEFWVVLKKDEKDLIREVEPERLAALDEDELLALHKRVRRARNKHVTNYRRKAAKRVSQDESRGKAHHKGGKCRLRAAAFEEALARVSERLAHVAHVEAERLKQERLDRARGGKGSGPRDSRPSGRGKGGTTGQGRQRRHQGTTGGAKRDASSKAQGARRQAKRDSR